MKTCRLDEIFDVIPHVGYDFKNLTSGNTPYCGASARNNGITQYVNAGKLKTYSNILSVALSGSVLSTFYHDEKVVFTPAKNITLIKSKKPMTFNEFMFYKTAIEENKFKFSYGRTASQGRITQLQIPTRESIPEWVYNFDYQVYKNNLLSKIMDLNISKRKIDTSNWAEFKITDLFDLKTGKASPKEGGNIPVITSTTVNNGIQGYCKNKLFVGGAITIATHSSGICFYQDNPFNISVNCLAAIPKFKITKNIGLFLITVMNLWESKYSYGRIANTGRIKAEFIKLPVTPDGGKPNWEYMETLISVKEKEEIHEI